MIVCVCHRISHRDIERQAAACESFDELQLNTGVATGCGRCGDCALALFQDARQAPSCPGSAACHAMQTMMLAAA